MEPEVSDKTKYMPNHGSYMPTSYSRLLKSKTTY